MVAVEEILERCRASATMNGGLTSQLCVAGGGVVEEEDTFDPCDRANPPDYCSEEGSCFDAQISDSYDRSILQNLENIGVLSDAWEKSNPDATDQSQHRERGGWIV